MAIRFSEFQRKTENLSQKTAARAFEAQIPIDESRENFYSSDKYNAGCIVEADAQFWEILDKRSNYVLLCNESGKVVKKFPKDIVPVNETVAYPSGTYKGKVVPGSIVSIIEFIETSDPVAVIKCIDAFESKNFVLFESVAVALGVSIEAINEASATEQKQAIMIVATAIGVKVSDGKPQDMMNSVLHSAKKLQLNPQRKEIMQKMFGLLQKLNIKTTLEEVHKNPDYDTEREILGYETLKKRLAAHTGIENYGDQEPGENIKLVDTSGNVIKQPHTAVGHSLGASNETHRKQLVRKLSHE